MTVCSDMTRAPLSATSSPATSPTIRPAGPAEAEPPERERQRGRDHPERVLQEHQRAEILAAHDDGQRDQPG